MSLLPTKQRQALIPASKPQKSLLQKVLVQQKLDVVNEAHLHFACASILQDTTDTLKGILQPRMNARKVTEDYLNYLSDIIREMQDLAGDDQLLTLQNNACMKEVLQKIIHHTKKGTIENVLNLILDYENEKI